MKEMENSNRKTSPQQNRGLLICYLYCLLLLLLLLVLGFWYCFSAIYFSTPFFLPLQKKSIGKGLYPAGALGISEQQSGCASEWEVERYKTKSALCLKRHGYILSK